MHKPYYWKEPIPDFLEEARYQSSLLRLDEVGMHCGLEYTLFDYFSSVAPYSRYEHSFGVALLAYHFTHDKKQAIAGLYHDLATPVFSHVVDFVMGDHLKQEATEQPTRYLMTHDPEIMEYLKKQGVEVEEVVNYHLYPICDCPAPKLSCDRLEYTLSNILKFQLGDCFEVRKCLQDLEVGKNEFGEDEIVFNTPELASYFGQRMLILAHQYTRKEDRYAMEALSRLLKECILHDVFTFNDLYYWGEPELIDAIECSSFHYSWAVYRSLYRVEDVRLEDPQALFTQSIPTKKRYIDPYVKGKGRLSQIDPEFGKKLQKFLQQDFQEELTGYSSSLRPSIYR